MFKLCIGRIKGYLRDKDLLKWISPLHLTNSSKLSNVAMKAFYKYIHEEINLLPLFKECWYDVEVEWMSGCRAYTRTQM